MQCLRFTMDHRFQLSRSTHSQMFFKKCVLNNFANFTEKHLCCSLFIKKRLQHWCFPVKFAKLIRTAFFQNTFLAQEDLNPRPLTHNVMKALEIIHLVCARNFPKNEHLLSPDTLTYLWFLAGKKCWFFGKFCAH